MTAFEGEAEHVYVITLSGKLSGSYNSAVLAAQLYNEEHEEGKQIHVFNSRSASIGETLIGLKVQEMEENGLSFEQVVEQVEEYIASMNTFFVLETLETLRKAGRLSNLKALVANTLNIKPVMGSTKEGMIQQLGQARGMKIVKGINNSPYVLRLDFNFLTFSSNIDKTGLHSNVSGRLTLKDINTNKDIIVRTKQDVIGFKDLNEISFYTYLLIKQLANKTASIISAL